MNYPNREIFPSSPLEFVACSVRFPWTPRLERSGLMSELHERLGDSFPVPLEDRVESVDIGPAGVRQGDTERRIRLMDPGRTTSMIVGRSEVVVETTHYDEYENFRATLGMVLEAVGGLAPIVGVERIGLRYIDEIRVPHTVDDTRDWRPWMAQPVLATLDLADGFDVRDAQASLNLTSEAGSVRLQYAALVGTGVIGDAPLKRRSPRREGPFFVIDIDSFMTRPSTDLMDFDVPTLLATVDQLHAPVGDLFHRSITDSLREEFRRLP